MAEHIFMVPGYAVRVSKYGPDWLRTVGGQPWSDIQGVPDGAGITFRGIGGTDNWFHFPITSPTFLNGQRLKCNLVAVTLDLEATNAFLKSVWVFDRLHSFFQSPGLTVSENLSDTWVTNKNVFVFPDREVRGAIGISVNVFFDQDANVKFTGAGARFHD